MFDRVDYVLDRISDVRFGDDRDDGLRKDCAKPAVAIWSADETVRQSANGGWNESCNRRLGDCERDGAGECDLNSRIVSKLMQALAYGQAHESNEIACN